MHALGDPAGQHPRTHRQDALCDQLSSYRPHNSHPDDLLQRLGREQATRRGRDDLDESPGLAGTARPVAGAVEQVADPRAFAVLLIRLRLREADVRHLGLGERDPRDRAGVPAPAPAQHARTPRLGEGVAGRDPALVVADVGELQRGGAVSGGEHPRCGRRQVLVDDDPFPGTDTDPRGRQVEITGPGGAPHGDQQVRAGHGGPVGQRELWPFGHRGDVPAEHERDAVSAEC